MAVKIVFLFALVTAVFCPSAEAAQISPVQKVLSMIDTLVKESTERLGLYVADFKAFGQLCDTTLSEKAYSMKSSGDEISSLEAIIYSSQAKIGDYQATIIGLSNQIAGTNGELYKANALRKKEHEDFMNVDKELVDAVNTLDVVRKSKEVSLAQLKPAQLRQIEAVKGGLKAVIEAGFVTRSQRAKVASFLEAQENANDSLEESGLGQTDTLRQVSEMAGETLSDSRRTEAVEQHEHDVVRMHLEDEINSMNLQLAATQQASKTTTQALAQAQKDLALERKSLSEDTAYASDMKVDCMIRSREFEANYRETSAELKAVNAAKGILVQKFSSSLLETRALLRSSARSVAISQDDDGKVKALRSIQQLGKKLHSTALVSLAYRASADPLGEVRVMVEQMIEKLQQAGVEEATHENFCKMELASSKSSKDLKQQDLENTDARIEKAESAVATISEQVAALSGDLSDLNAASASAQSLRTVETQNFGKASYELIQSVAACGSAISALQQYYDSGAAALLQQTTTAQGAEGILMALREAEFDFSKQLSEARTAEQMAVTKFQEFVQDSRVDKTVKQADLASKQSQVKSLKVALANYGEDKEGKSAEFDAVSAYLAELKPKCALQAPPSYAETKMKREQEIQGLKDALKMLE